MSPAAYLIFMIVLCSFGFVGWIVTDSKWILFCFGYLVGMTDALIKMMRYLS